MVRFHGAIRGLHWAIRANKRVGVVQSFVSFFVYVEFMGFMGLSDLRFKAIYSQIEKID